MSLTLLTAFNTAETHKKQKPLITAQYHPIISEQLKYST